MVKGQIFSVREIFSFLIGILLIASVFTIFTQDMNGRIAEFSIKENLRNVVEQVRLGAAETASFAEQGGEVVNVTYKLELPEKLASYPYSVKASDGEVCAKILGYSKVLTSCGKLNLPLGAVTRGTFLSGTKMDVTVEKSAGVFRLTLAND